MIKNQEAKKILKINKKQILVKVPQSKKVKKKEKMKKK